MEATVKHLVSVYPYSKFLTLKQAFIDFHSPNNLPDGVTLAGLCIKPVRTPSLGDSGNYTDTFEVVAIGWGEPVVDPANITVATPGPISLFNIVDYANQKFTNNADPNKLSVLDSVKMASTGVFEVSALHKLRYYDKTAEFEYVFIDIQTFEYLAKSDSNLFYVKKSGQLFVSEESTTPIQTSDRGLLLSRAFMVMKEDTAANGTTVVNDISYKRYRTLRFAPFPEPKMESSESRPSLAYYLGPACPPFWRNTGAEEFEVDSSASGMIELRAMSISIGNQQLNDDSLNISDCNCVVNKIDMAELHQKLISEGIVNKKFDKNEVYNFKWWPWILLGLGILTLVAFGVTDIVQRIKG